MLVSSLLLNKNKRKKERKMEGRDRGVGGGAGRGGVDDGGVHLARRWDRREGVEGRRQSVGGAAAAIR